ncbi:hypothetical protein V1478_005161 [Vespula squamosa]|uniref:Uncharacterized protein n=1 Tax=Vespula squamosa TaxID=30214 RepID=A0ABD2BDD4_VESSQ
MAIGHVCSHTTSHAQSEETWDASCNQGKFVFTEDHFAEKNVSGFVHSFRYRIESRAIGHVGSHTTSHAESEETWDASTNKGLLFSTKEHFVQKNVSWGLFFSTLKSCRPSPEEKIKIDRDTLSVLRPFVN